MISSSPLGNCGSVAFLPTDNTPNRLLSPCSMGTQIIEPNAESNDKVVLKEMHNIISSLCKGNTFLGEPSSLRKVWIYSLLTQFAQ